MERDPRAYINLMRMMFQQKPEGAPGNFDTLLPEKQMYYYRFHGQEEIRKFFKKCYQFKMIDFEMLSTSDDNYICSDCDYEGEHEYGQYLAISPSKTRSEDDDDDYEFVGRTILYECGFDVHHRLNDIYQTMMHINKRALNYLK